MRLPVDRTRLPPRWTAIEGLSIAEVEERRRRYGANDVLEPTQSAWKKLLGDTARDPMIWFMVATSALYLWLGEHAEGWTLLVATLPLAGMDAFLHRRAQASLAGLSEGLAVSARVLREGGWREVSARDVVVGDLLEARAGEGFAADGLLLEAHDAQAEESSLTGEAFPVRKHALHDLSAAPVESEHWGLAGTRLLTGTARVRVLRVGAETLYGQISRSSAESRHTRTPLQQAVTHLVGALVIAAGAFCAVLAFVRWRQGYGWVDALVSAATLAVAALPEEFPVALTFFLGVGVFRLARRRALVRRAVSIENLGRVTCICSDKTGTLTEGRLRVVSVLPAEGVSERELAEVAAMASRPEAGDPLDLALSAHLASRPMPERRATFPFTEERRRETVVLEVDGQLRAVTKGAPELILGLCDLAPGASGEWHRRLESLAAGGRKVLACADTTLPGTDWHGGEPERGLRFLGLIALEDPLRAGVREAVASCARAGIRTVMVTGDHPHTARAIAEQLGLGGPDGPRVVLGEALERGDPLERIDVVARAMPSEKLELVRALQARSEVVAVTGDGVNDVPALQAADVGIAMGERGTRPAKDAAAIVLLDDNFRSIVGAIVEGRQLFRNLRASFQYLLLVHIPLVITAALIPLAGYPLLYLPIHVVWLELIIHPTAMLAFQAPARDAELEPRGRAKPRFFEPADALAIAVSGASSVVLIVWGYQRSLGAHYHVGHARALALAFLVIASSLFNLILTRGRTRAARVVALLSLLASAALIQLPIARWFSLEPLHADDWAFAAIGASAAALPVLLRLGWRQARSAQRTGRTSGPASRTRSHTATESGSPA